MISYAKRLENISSIFSKCTIMSSALIASNLVLKSGSPFSRL